MNFQFNSQDWYKHRILIVDDMIDNTSLLTTVLEVEGYQVDVANDGYTAIFKIEENPPSLVLLDAMMPEIDGFEVAQWIRQNRSHVNILLITACDQTSIVSKLNNLALQVDGLIYKPINIKELLEKIQTILAPAPSEKMLF
ncbi:MAG: response regulator transcription factor [Waterburya sp.]